MKWNEMIFIQPLKLQASTFIMSWTAWHKIRIEIDKAISIIKQWNAYLMINKKQSTFPSRPNREGSKARKP